MNTTKTGTMKRLSGTEMKKIKGGNGYWVYWNCYGRSLICHPHNPIESFCAGEAEYCVPTRWACYVAECG